jgi:hypothetical protein
MKTLTISARPATHEDHGFWVTSFMLFGGPQGLVEFEVSADTPQGILKAAQDHLRTLPVPDGKDGWSAHVVRPSRWPNGFKKALDNRGFVVDMRSAVSA